MIQILQQFHSMTAVPWYHSNNGGRAHLPHSARQLQNSLWQKKLTHPATRGSLKDRHSPENERGRVERSGRGFTAAGEQMDQNLGKITHSLPTAGPFPLSGLT